MEHPSPTAITLSRDQARWLGLYVAGITGATSVDIDRSPDGTLGLAVFDKTGERIAQTVIDADPQLP